ncbi:retrovirus-related pol polyprotein from transposon TNT 1-94 [Tanacetum coccineum]
MEKCHKLLTNQVDEGLLRYNVSRPLPLGGPPGQVTIQTEFFFNKDLEYLRFGHKGDRLVVSITKMNAASYPDAGLEQIVPDMMWAKEEYMYDISASYGVSHWWFKRQQFYIDRHLVDTNRRGIVRTHMRILSVVRIEVFSLYAYDYMKKIVLRRADNQEYTNAESDFKDLYPSDFEDLDRYRMQMIMRFNEIHKFSDGTLQQINEALHYQVKEFMVNKVGPHGSGGSSKDGDGDTSFQWSQFTTPCSHLIFNTIITSLKALDESFSSRNHVRKFLRALPTKWRQKDSEISNSKKEKYKSLALKARKVLSEEEATSSDSNDEEYAIVNQQEGIDFDETYAPVARLESIRILLAYAYAHDFKLYQMDVKSAFLNGFINEEVYVAQPLGFIDFEKPNHVFKLKNALYGLKISVRPCCFSYHRPVSPPYHALSPPTDYQTAPPSTLNALLPLCRIISSGISPSKILLTPKSTPPPLTSPPPAPTQPSKHSSTLSINLDPIELLFSTPPSSPQAFFDSLEDVPPKTTNPLPPRPSFDSIKHLANEPSHLLAMEPPLLPFPPQLPTFPRNPPSNLLPL